MITINHKTAPEAYVKNEPRHRNYRRTMTIGYFLFFYSLAALVVAAQVSSGALILPLAAAFWMPAGLLLAASILLISMHRALEWERAIVLRLGKFHRVRGPGLYWTLPFIDSISALLDIRIRVSDFSAQETLTLDSVTVTVDALCFWLVWDPQKAALEVENYEDAVILSSKTALRHAVSSFALTQFLESGAMIRKQLQEEVDKKTNEWGITVQYIEITDIQIPESLQDSLSRLAQAEREKKARILFAEAEIEIAAKLQEASRTYSENSSALKLKVLSILNEGLKAGNSMLLVPSSLVESVKDGG
ncbi:MAG: slipin family protein [Spirochaetaceae bacterium]|jgi:regulator of protease activity HflC (stomatin/prohibitin superfamily)|nr:slipin family protein [Spirochaetaceae bacterium]